MATRVVEAKCCRQQQQPALGLVCVPAIRSRSRSPSRFSQTLTAGLYVREKFI